MMRPRFTLKGFGAFERTLGALDRVARDDIVEKALRAGGEVIADEARRLAPVKTGNLRDSIIVTTSAEDVDRAYVPLRLDGITVFVGPEQDVEYAVYVEYGTARSSAQPFMRPAFDARGGDAMREIAAVISVEFARAGGA